MISGAVFGLAVMLLWGVADLLQTLAIRRIGAPSTMLARGALALILGGAVLGGLALISEPRLPTWTAAVIAGGSLAYAVGYAAYMRGLEIGAVTRVTPIASSLSIVTVALAALFAGSEVGAATLGMIALVILGIAMLSGGGARRSARSGAGLREAQLAMLLFGVAFFILARAPDAPALPVLFAGRPSPAGCASWGSAPRWAAGSARRATARSACWLGTPRCCTGDG